MKPRIVTLLGTRPEIIKLSTLLPILDEEADHILIHSGQHYSAELDRVFFEELELKQAALNLGVGSGPPAAQTGKIMGAFESELARLDPDGVIVLGDTNTGAAGALAVAKSGHRAHLFHVESLLRCHNMKVAEEVNRVLIDRLSDTLFSVNEGDLATAKAEGIDPARVICTGNTLADCCLRMAGKVKPAHVLPQRGLEAGKYVFVTFHRQESVDSRETLEGLLGALEALAKEVTVAFAVHPRTQSRIKEFGLKVQGTERLKLLPPLGYRDTIGLLASSLFSITDSGGLLEESAILGVPSLIARNEVEQVYFVNAGIHRLTPPRRESLLKDARAWLSSPDELERRRKTRLDIPTGVSRAVADHILRILGSRSKAK